MECVVGGKRGTFHFSGENALLHWLFQWWNLGAGRDKQYIQYCGLCFKWFLRAVLVKKLNWIRMRKGCFQKHWVCIKANTLCVCACTHSIMLQNCKLDHTLCVWGVREVWLFFFSLIFGIEEDIFSSSVTYKECDSKSSFRNFLCFLFKLFYNLQ